MFKVLVPLLQFLPNVLSAYKSRPLQQTSEGYMLLISALGAVLAYFNVVPQDDYQTALVPAIVYVLGRFLSKGLAPAK